MYLKKFVQSGIQTMALVVTVEKPSSGKCASEAIRKELQKELLQIKSLNWPSAVFMYK